MPAGPGSEVRLVVVKCVMVTVVEVEVEVEVPLLVVITTVGSSVLREGGSDGTNETGLGALNQRPP